MFTVKVATQFFNQPSLQPPVYTNLTWEVLMCNNNFLIKMAGKNLTIWYLIM